MRDFSFPSLSRPDSIRAGFLQFEVILADILISAVFQLKAGRNRPGLNEAKPFVQMSGIRVAFYNSVKLHNSKAGCSGLFDTVFHQLFANMVSAMVFFYREAGVADPAEPSLVVGMKNICSNYYSVFVFRDADIGLCRKQH